MTERARRPDDYVVEVIHGLRVPKRADIRHTMVARCAWLQRRIERDSKLGNHTSHGAVEFAYEVALVEIAEARWKREDLEREYISLAEDV